MQKEKEGLLLAQGSGGGGGLAFSLESLKCVRPKEETDEKGFCSLSCFCGQPPAGVEAA